MVLPLYLAVTAAEITALYSGYAPLAWMACHFSPYTQGLTNIPETLPEGSMLILNDRMPCQGHSADLVAHQLRDIAEQHRCESVLLDFQRPPEPESEAMVETIIRSLSCPVAVTEDFAGTFSCPVFLSPAPLHIPLEEYIAPWKGREIWLEAALCQEDIPVTENGVRFVPQFPADHLSEGFYDENLHCRYITKPSENAVTFTLFDTPESLEKKLDHAHALGITRAVGLWQELGCFMNTQKPLTFR